MHTSTCERDVVVGNVTGSMTVTLMISVQTAAVNDTDDSLERDLLAQVGPTPPPARANQNHPDNSEETSTTETRAPQSGRMPLEAGGRKGRATFVCCRSRSLLCPGGSGAARVQPWAKMES